MRVLILSILLTAGVIVIPRDGASQAGFWSLRPLRVVRPPSRPAGSAVDAFLFERLAASGLTFAPEAGRAVLIRRLTFDLHGLPPTAEEVASFVEDQRPEAYARLVDRLLASPRFGERFARRWLDVARFAESDGYEHDDMRPQAWKYRDWVIRAFNEDLPYDRFAKMQLAGDALTDAVEGRIATGFILAGTFDDVAFVSKAPMLRAEARQDELEDIIGTTAQAFLGLTAQCARCHDHKFDPIPQVDYYRLSAVFASAVRPTHKSKDAVYGVISETPRPVHVLRRGNLSSPQREVGPGALSCLTHTRSEFGDSSLPAPERRLRLAEWIVDPRNALAARVVVNRVWAWMFGRGLVATPNDFGANGDRPSHPELLDWLAADFIQSGRSMKRLVRQLALTHAYRQGTQWNARAAALDPDQRLLWRRRPRRLEAEEVRDAMLAIAGQLNPALGGPGFQLFNWRENAGTLYTAIDRSGAEFQRRAIYRTVVRGTEDPLLTGLDCPDPSNPTPRRESTTTATQALNLLNNSFVDRMSRQFAERLRNSTPNPTQPPSLSGKGESNELDAQVHRSYALAFGRSPTPAEVERATRFVERHGMPAWCRALFNASEFLYVE